MSASCVLKKHTYILARMNKTNICSKNLCLYVIYPYELTIIDSVQCVVFWFEHVFSKNIYFLSLLQQIYNKSCLHILLNPKYTEQHQYQLMVLNGIELMVEYLYAFYYILKTTTDISVVSGTTELYFAITWFRIQSEFIIFLKY